MTTLLQTRTAVGVKLCFLAVLAIAGLALWVVPEVGTALRIVLTVPLLLALLTRNLWVILITQWIWDRRRDSRG